MKSMKALITISMLIIGTFVVLSTCAYAAEETIVVSLGDSYSSGEGIEKFYGQEDTLEKKVKNVDWLAHRSKNSWPGMLLGANGEPMKKGENWFFMATSGATTWELSHPFEKKYYKVRTDKDSLGFVTAPPLKGKKDVPAQLDIFDILREDGKTADYVTITIGGNDLGFSQIMKKAATESWFNKHKGSQTVLEAMLEDAWLAFEGDKDETPIKDDIENAYVDIERAAGKQAKIIVAGYPKLLSESELRLSYTLFSKGEAEAINEKVNDLNMELEKLVEECKGRGMNIVFVPVITEFEGHGAYSKHPFINDIELIKADDIADNAEPPISSYSFHPNIRGAKLYAKCVQNEIEVNPIETKDVIGVWDWAGSGVTPSIKLKKDGSLEVEEVIGEWVKRGIWSCNGANVIVVRDGSEEKLKYDKKKEILYYSDYGKKSCYKKRKSKESYSSDSTLITLGTGFKRIWATDNTTYVDGKEFFFQEDLNNDNAYELMITDSDETRTLVNNVEMEGLTNGEFVIYSKKGFVERENDHAPKIDTFNKIYAMNLKTGKRKLITSGWGFIPIACKGKYLYAGCDDAMSGVKLYSVDIATKRKVFMRDNADRSNLSFGNGRVLVSNHRNDPDNYPIYIFNENGKGGKKIANGMEGIIKDGMVYYATIRFTEEGEQYKTYRCDFEGNQREDVTGWGDNYKLP